MSCLKKWVAAALLFSTSSTVLAQTNYISTNRDTLLETEEMTFTTFDSKDYDLIHETNTYKYYFRDDRDIIAVEDKRNGYTWKTGLDVEFGSVIDEQCEAASESDKVNACVPKEDRLNTTYTGMANSLITIEYFDDSKNIKRISSASATNAKSELKKVEGQDGKFTLNVTFSKPRLQVKVNILLDDKGIHYEIKDEDVKGDGQDVLAAILVTPFLGASGGQQKIYNPETNDYDKIVKKEMTPGYVLVPDGPGALIRFKDNTTSLIQYSGNVYGQDYAQGEFYQRNETFYVPMKDPVLPVYGISHGKDQSAFVSYATDGAEYMEVVAVPEENMTAYTIAYPRFVYNNLYHQVYNKKGDGYYMLLEERNHYDINLSYEFLEGDGLDGEPSADYFGMAKAYQKALVDQGVLTQKEQSATDMPIRLDFLMADVKKTVLGKENVVVTTVEDVRAILNDLKAAGVENVNSGLLGYQKGGLTFRKPGKVKWDNKIGSKKEFEALIKEFKALGVDLSFSDDYVMFSPNEVMEYNTSVKHANGWYLRYNLLSLELPETTFTYARPEVSVNWMNSQLDKLLPLGISSMTIDGISNTLLSDFTKEGTTLTEAKELVTNSVVEMSDDVLVNAVKPNAYLLAAIDRYLQAPVFSSQYLIETDTVPFLQIVLSNMMEVYAPYSNFSFSSDADVLRMIDYNVLPSFVITEEPSYLLSNTNSSNFYSTEYASYKADIVSVYGKLNETLGAVKNSAWLSRDVVEPGVVVNTYENGVKIIINYTESAVTVNGQLVSPLSYSVVK